MEAVRDGDVARVHALFDERVNVDARDSQGRTALMAAADYGHVEITQLLLARGANIDEQDRKGRTALMFAAYYSHTAVVRALLEAGLAPVAPTGTTPGFAM